MKSVSGRIFCTACMTFEITVPPLRDCQEDIMPLAEFFREMANRNWSAR